MSTSYSAPNGAAPNGSANPEALGTGINSGTADLAETARHDLDELGTELKEQVGTLKQEAASQLEDVTAKAKSLASEQKDLLSEQVGGIVEAIDKVAGELEGSEASSAGYVRLVADGAKKLSSTIKDNDVDSILHMAQDFGRQKPVAFMGAAALLGFAASRFVLASASRKASPNALSTSNSANTSSANTSPSNSMSASTGRTYGGENGSI